MAVAIPEKAEDGQRQDNKIGADTNELDPPPNEYFKVDTSNPDQVKAAANGMDPIRAVARHYPLRHGATDGPGEESIAPDRLGDSHPHPGGGGNFSSCSWLRFSSSIALSAALATCWHSANQRRTTALPQRA